VIDGTSSSGDVGPAAASDGGQDKSSASSLSSVALHVYVVAALVAVLVLIAVVAAACFVRIRRHRTYAEMDVGPVVAQFTEMLCHLSANKKVQIRTHKSKNFNQQSAMRRTDAGTKCLYISILITLSVLTAIFQVNLG